LKISKALDEIYNLAVSKRDLKPCWTFLWRNACDLGFAACQHQPNHTYFI